MDLASFLDSSTRWGFQLKVSSSRTPRNFTLLAQDIFYDQILELLAP